MPEPEPALRGVRDRLARDLEELRHLDSKDAANQLMEEYHIVRRTTWSLGSPLRTKTPEPIGDTDA